MYNVDPTIVDRAKKHVQTKATNSDPRPQAFITRNKTPITSQRFWEEQKITDTIGTRSSIAVRRPEGFLMGDMIFTAQVENDTAVIRYAEPNSNINEMKWTVLTTVPNVSELSLIFDGYMKQSGDETVEAYTNGTLPYVFYVSTSGELLFLNLDDESISGSVSANAVNIASVRGLYSDAIGLDDGIFIFYTNASGELWEADFVSGEVTSLTQITKLPVGVTSWLDVWAGVTWDYRIILQLKGNDGKVYTLVSSSRTSGFNNLEHIALTKVSISGQIGESALTLLGVESVGV